MEIFLFIFLGIIFLVLLYIVIPYKIFLKDDALIVRKLLKSTTLPIVDIISVRQTVQNRKLRLTTFGIFKTISTIDILIIESSHSTFILNSKYKGYNMIRKRLLSKIQTNPTKK